MANTITFEPMFEDLQMDDAAKIELQESFDKAVVKKTTELMEEYVETQVNERVEVLEEEYKEKVENLTESLDGYLDQVVEDFIAENAPSYEAQIDEEKTKSLLEMFDTMLTVAGVEMLKINEAKDTDEEENTEDKDKTIAQNESKIDDMAQKLVEARREADKYLQAGVIKEISEGLTVLETAKFEKLSEMVAFDRNPSYLDKLETIKESILDNRTEEFQDKIELPTAAFRQPEKVSSKDALDFSKYV